MKTRFLKPVLILLASAVSAAVFAHGDDPKSKAKAKGETLGQVLFKTSCTPEAQKQFERALAMLHSFYFPETIKAFTAVPETDPSCAIAYWGIAVSIRPNPLVGPWDAATLKRGLDAVEKGQAIGAKTERERDWLAAIKEFYKDFDKVDQDTRTRNYEKAMEALAKKYPNDVEAKIFHALALNEIFDHKNMEPLLKAIKILEPLDKKYPEHPGITHYLIHSYDFAPIAKKGVPAANKYAKIAPSAPHAQHMPSHIYSMVGMWKESIASNISFRQGRQRIRGEGEARRRARRGAARVRLHAVRLPAARPGCEGEGADREERGDQEGDRPGVRRQHRARRCARALLPRAPGLEGRGAARSRWAPRFRRPRRSRISRVRWARRAAAISRRRRRTSRS